MRQLVSLTFYLAANTGLFFWYSGCIKPLCDLLEVKDAKVVIVALEGLENILRAGEQQKTNDINDVATMIDEADGVSKIQALQYHANEGKMCIFAGCSRTWR